MIPQLEVLMCLILQEEVQGTLPPAHPNCPVSVCISLEWDSLFMGTDHASMLGLNVPALACPCTFAELGAGREGVGRE